MTTANTDEFERHCRFVYAYFNQDEVWFPNGKPRTPIADMDPAWRLNCLRFLERRATAYELMYTFGETWAMSQPVCSEALGRMDGADVLSGRMFSHFDLMSDMAEEYYRRAMDERATNPVGWIRATTLFEALSAGLPDCSIAQEALRERGRHWSTCPARESTDAECHCEAIRAERAVTP